MRTVFLDTVGLIAVWDSADPWHAAADQVVAELLRHHVRLITTTLVLYECGSAAARKPYRSIVDEFRQELAGSGDLVEPTQADIDQDWADFAAGLAGSAGIVDHVSFAVMRRLGLAEGQWRHGGGKRDACPT